MKATDQNINNTYDYVKFIWNNSYMIILHFQYLWLLIIPQASCLIGAQVVVVFRQVTYFYLAKACSIFFARSLPDAWDKDRISINYKMAVL